MVRVVCSDWSQWARRETRGALAIALAVLLTPALAQKPVQKAEPKAASASARAQPALPTAAAAPAALEPDALFARLEPSIWRVIAYDAQQKPLSGGSAVVIGPGRLITNCHVLTQAASVGVARDNVTYGAILEFPDPERDLCQLKVNNFSAPAVEMADMAALRVGMKVYALGSPRGLEMTLSDGLLSGLRRDEDGQLAFIQTTAPVSPGSSGGGLFDTRGRLVGITTLSRRDSQNLNFAIPASQVLEVPARGQEALLARRRATAGSDAVTAAAPAAPAASAASAASAGTEAAPLGRRAGDWFEYVITDTATGIKRAVALQVDRVDGDRVLFNGGTRREGEAGQLMAPLSQTLGELDVVTPPGGWAQVQAPGSHTLKFDNQVLGRLAQFELTAVTAAPAPLAVGAGRYEAVRIELTGWHTRAAVPSGQGRAPYKATVWWVPELRRAVRFTVDSRTVGGVGSPGGYMAWESLELVRAIQR